MFPRDSKRRRQLLRISLAERPTLDTELSDTLRFGFNPDPLDQHEVMLDEQSAHCVLENLPTMHPAAASLACYCYRALLDCRRPLLYGGVFEPGRGEWKEDGAGDCGCYEWDS